VSAESGYGMWWDPTDPENTVAGLLSWESLRSPTLSLLDAPARMWAGTDLASGQGVDFGEQPVPMLHGKLADKGIVTLLDCRFFGMSLGRTSTHRLRIGKVLTGTLLHARDEAFVRRMEVELPALEALLGAYPVHPVRYPTTQSRQIRLTLDHRQQSWKEGTTEITWEYQCSTSVRPTSTRVEMTPTLVLTNSAPKSLDYWIDEWVGPTNQLMTVATGAKSNPRSVTVWVKKNLTPAERHTTGISLWAQGVGEHEYQYRRDEVLLRAPQIDLNPKGLPDVIRQTRRLSADHDVFLSLLAGVINYSDRPMRNRYLDLTSGLEAYHSQVHGVGPISVDTFKAKRKAAIDAVASARLDLADRRFIQRWLLSRPSYSLEDRLRRLATDVGVLKRWTIDAQQMSALRNDVAHGKTAVDLQLLRGAYDQARDLARRVVLRELGIVSHSANGSQPSRPSSGGLSTVPPVSA
jgi:hypothetical protein